jgi:hypothetical protein
VRLNCTTNIVNGFSTDFNPGNDDPGNEIHPRYFPRMRSARNRQSS